MSSTKGDLLAPVRQKLLEENQHLLVNLPQNLEATVVNPDGRVKADVLTGAARTKLQFVAAVPAAVAAGIIGYLGGPKSNEK